MDNVIEPLDHILNLYSGQSVIEFARMRELTHIMLRMSQCLLLVRMPQGTLNQNGGYYALNRVFASSLVRVAFKGTPKRG